MVVLRVGPEINNIMIGQAGFLLALLSRAACDCAFAVNTSGDPNPVTEDQKTPFDMDYSAVCSDFVGKKVCCSQFQNVLMGESFQQIDIIFGSANGGCDVCAVNLKRFWCEYTCSPNQSKFVQARNYTKAMSYQKNMMVDVEEIKLTVESSTACALFQSCKRTSYATQISAMQSPAGFLSFQGDNAVDSGKQIISVKFTNDPEAGLYIPDLDPCKINITSPHRGFEVKANCSCNSCEDLCSSAFKFTPLPVLQGLNVWLVGGVWAVGLAVVLTVEWRRRTKARAEEQARGYKRCD